MTALLQFLFFTFEMYIVQWFEVTIPAHAVTSDLNLVKDILIYHDSAIRKVCFVVVGHHSWYLSEHLISLSLFDSQPEVSSQPAHNDGMIMSPT